MTERPAVLIVHRHLAPVGVLLEGAYDEMIKGLRCGDIDVVVGGLPPNPPPDLTQEKLFEDGLSRFGGPWLAGAEFTAVDAFFAPVAFRIRTYGLDVGKGQAWVDHVLAHPAMLDWEEGLFKGGQALFDALWTRRKRKPYQAAEITLASLRSFSTSSCTEPTFLPAWRLAGSFTLTTVSRGAGSTPRSAGFTVSIGFLRAFMMLGSEA